MDVFFPNAFDDLTIAKESEDETTANMKMVFKNVAREFEKMIEQQSWMSRSTKRSAKEKVQAMKINVGERTPNTMEYGKLTEKITDDDYIANILAIGNYHFDSLVKKLNKPILSLSPYPEQQFGAFYFHQKNEFTILTGLLHGLLGTGVNFDIPLGLIYGGLMVIGHEMFHGFDDTGSLFDKEGMRFNWWRPKEAKIYEERIKCLVRKPLSLGIKTITFSGVTVSELQYPI